jgi:hypothetical protein
MAGTQRAGDHELGRVRSRRHVRRNVGDDRSLFDRQQCIHHDCDDRRPGVDGEGRIHNDDVQGDDDHQRQLTPRGSRGLPP